MAGTKKVGNSDSRAREKLSGVDVWCRFDEAQDVTSLVENPRNPNTQSSQDPAADLADKSGLFATPSQPAQTSTAKREKGKRGTIGGKGVKGSSTQRKSTSKATTQKQPLHSGEVNLPQNPPNEPETDQAQGFMLKLDISDSKAVYMAVRQAEGSKSMQWQLANMVRDRFLEESKALISRTRGGDSSPPTREELIGIVSEALRRENATGSDVKGLTATLQSLLPDLFTSGDDSSKPGPDLVLAYITRFAGQSGESLADDLGGRAFVAGRLSELLGCPVSVG